MQEAAVLFKALSDPTRLRLAAQLALHDELCVCVLAAALDEPEFKISRHLGILRSAGLVAARRDGKWMHYRLTAARTRLEACLQLCFRDGLGELASVQADARRAHRASCERQGEN